jgi:hypothetical protein
VVSPHLTWRVEIILKHWIPTGTTAGTTTTTTTTTTCALPRHGDCFCLISIDCWFYDFLITRSIDFQIFFFQIFQFFSFMRALPAIRPLEELHMLHCPSYYTGVKYYYYSNNASE